LSSEWGVDLSFHITLLAVIGGTQAAINLPGS
jgi:hypothetical protein